jgi:hypothetical protein
VLTHQGLTLNVEGVLKRMPKRFGLRFWSHISRDLMFIETNGGLMRVLFHLKSTSLQIKVRETKSY